jgi:hypothetical protein
MKLTRVINVENLDEYVVGDIIKFKKNTSFTGGKATEGFVNEWDKGNEVLFDIEDCKTENYKELTIDDVDDYDVLEVDVEGYNEHRNLIETKYEITDVWDSGEMGYITVFLKEI